MNRYSLSAVLGGVLWGCIGLFTRSLSEAGFSSWDMVAIRAGIAALCFGAWGLVKGGGALRIRLRDLWCFLGVGICSLLFFTFCYFSAQRIMDLSTASVLLYTAPIFVMLLSRILFGERMGGMGIVALVLCFAGVVLVSGIGGRISPLGLAYGLGSGIGYALFSIFSRFALNRGYHSLTINFYACLFGSLGALLFSGPAEPVRLMFSSGQTVLLSLGLAVAACFLPYAFYTYSLEGIENSRASILASVEPVVATLWGVFLFREPMTPMALCGVVLVLGAVVLMNLGKKPD